VLLCISHDRTDEREYGWMDGRRNIMTTERCTCTQSALTHFTNFLMPTYERVKVACVSFLVHHSCTFTERDATAGMAFFAFVDWT